MLEVTKSRFYEKNGKVWGDYHVNGKRERFSLGMEWNENNLAKAKSEPLIYIYERYNKDAQEVRVVKNAVFATISSEFLSGIKGQVKPQSLENYKAALSLMEREFFKNKVVSSWDENLMDKFRDYLEKRRGTRAKAELFNRLIPIAQNYGARIKKLIVRHLKDNTKKKELNPFSLDEIKQLLALSANDKELNTFIAVSAFSGLRTGEMCALSWEDIDFENEIIKVSKSLNKKTNKIGTTKTGKSREVDLLSVAKDALKRLGAKESGRIFRSRRSKIQARYDALFKGANVAWRNIYQLRHTFATIMFEKGEEHLWISQMLGHSDLSITYAHYVRQRKEKKKRAAFLDFDASGEMLEKKRSE